MDGYMMSLGAHRLTPKRACDQRGAGQFLPELGPEGRTLRLLAGGPQGHPSEWRSSVARTSPYLMVSPTSSSLYDQISIHCLARNPRAMTWRPGHAVKCAQSKIC